jgi:hypothetical protein
MPSSAILADVHRKNCQGLLLANRGSTAKEPLGQTRQADRDRVAVMFGFVRFSDFQRTIRSVLPLAYELERITPDLANNGANPEYPWPHAAPQFAPATFTFAAWERMCSGNGRQLMRLIESAVERFPEYSDI